jgi:cyclophilin family peptidyl-prolyl cis-trans isomerase
MKKVHFETTKGNIVAELYEDDAPNTVANFAGLIQGTKEWKDPKTGEKVKKPFYDGLSFHRVIPEFVIQGGCPVGNGTGGPGYMIKCETGGKKQVHNAGSLSMAHAGKDTGGSQFFICLTREKTAHLDRKHTVFGQVTEGMDVVKKIQGGDRMTKVWIEE